MPPQNTHQFLIIADGQFEPMTSKTANCCIRYMPERVVGVFDRGHAGKTVQDVLGFGGTIPVVGDFERGLGLGATAVLIGIAPMGGRLPAEWRGAAFTGNFTVHLSAQELFDFGIELLQRIEELRRAPDERAPDAKRISITFRALPWWDEDPDPG